MKSHYRVTSKFNELASNCENVFNFAYYEHQRETFFGMECFLRLGLFYQDEF